MGPTPSAVPERLVLEGVPRAGFYDNTRCPEDYTFPGSLRAALEYLGDNRGCDHTQKDPSAPFGCLNAYILGVSGMASRLNWHATQCFPGNNNTIYMAPDPAEPYRRAFEAVGYGHEMILRSAYAEEVHFSGTRCDDEAYYRQRIVESLRDRGRPVLAFGVAGPPEVCLITGYDEGGDVLTGWSYFQGFPEFNAGLEFEPNGYFRKRDWFKDTQGLILLGEKQPRPPAEVIFRQALQWMAQGARTPRMRKFHTGHAAYEAWAGALLRDESFPADDMGVLRAHYMTHFDATSYVAEARWYGSLFLRQAARAVPAWAPELEKAADCYVAEHDLMWAVWEFGGGNGVDDEKAKRLAMRWQRERIVPLIYLARKEDIEATERIERALAL